MSGLQAQATPITATDSFFNFLLSIFDSALLETAVVIIILTLFFFCRTQHPNWKLDDLSKAPARKSKQTGGKTSKSSSHQTKPGKPEEAQQVQKLFKEVVGRGLRAIPEVVRRYDVLVHEQGICLNLYLTDLQQARSFYVGLIAASLKTSQPEFERSPGKACRSRSSSEAFRLLSDMRAFGFPRNLEFYSLLMKLHAQDKLFHDVLALFEEMKADRIEPDCGLCICLLNSAVECGDGKAKYFFDKLCQFGSPSLRTFMTMLRMYAQRKDWQGAVILLEQMSSNGSAPDNLALNHVLALCVSVGQVHVAESLLSKYTDLVDVITCNTLLKGYTHQSDLPKAEALLEHMLAKGPAPNVISFNTIMDCAVRVIHAWNAQGRRARGKDKNSHSIASAMPSSIRSVARRPWALLDTMVDLGIAPDRYTVSTIVKGMHMTGGTADELDRAVALVRELGPTALLSCGPSSMNPRDCNTRLVEVIFNTLLATCCSSRDLDRMMEIFALMQEFGVETSPITFGTLIKAFSQAGQLQRCHDVWKQMRSLTLEPTVVTYGCYIDACIRNEDVASAEQLFTQMEEERVRPNAVIYTSLIRGLAAASQTAKAFNLYRRMRQDGVQPTSVTFNSVLDLVSRQLSDPAVLQEVLSDIKNSNTAPDVVADSILIKASCNAGYFDNDRTLETHG